LVINGSDCDGGRAAMIAGRRWPLPSSSSVPPFHPIPFLEGADFRHYVLPQVSFG
jgi:hypothetical protein